MTPPNEAGAGVQRWIMSISYGKTGAAESEMVPYPYGPFVFATDYATVEQERDALRVRVSELEREAAYHKRILQKSWDFSTYAAAVLVSDTMPTKEYLAEFERIGDALQDELKVILSDCATCYPDGLFAENGEGPFTCYVCGKPPQDQALRPVGGVGK